MESFKNFAEQHEREYLDLLRQGAATGGLAGAEVPTNCLKTICSPSTRLEFVPTAQNNYSDLVSPLIPGSLPSLFALLHPAGRLCQGPAAAHGA